MTNGPRIRRAVPARPKDARTDRVYFMLLSTPAKTALSGPLTLTLHFEGSSWSVEVLTEVISERSVHRDYEKEQRWTLVSFASQATPSLALSLVCGKPEAAVLSAVSKITLRWGEDQTLELLRAANGAYEPAGSETQADPNFS